MNRFSLGVLFTGFACLALAETETEQKAQKRIPLDDLVVTKNSIVAECRQVTPAMVARILEMSAWISTEQFGASIAARHFELPQSELEFCRASVTSTTCERGRLTNQELERFLEKLEVDAEPKPLTESE